MARVPYLEMSDLSAENQDLLKRRISLFQALVNSPNAARAFGGLGQFIRFGSKLDPRLRELAILQVGWLARSPYEWSHHVKLGHDFGVSDADIQALIDDTAGKPTHLTLRRYEVIEECHLTLFVRDDQRVREKGQVFAGDNMKNLKGSIDSQARRQVKNGSGAN